ncbi:MAG: hypothetical protein R6X12_04210 [bacterium]
MGYAGKEGQWRGRNWSQVELRVVERYARKVLNEQYPSVRVAIENCRDDLDRLRRKHPDARWAARPRTRVAVNQRLAELTRASGLSRPETRWGRLELSVVNRFARAFVRGRYPEVRLAARDCRAALLRAREERPDGERLVARRSELAVREQVRLRLRELGRRTSLRRWSERELRVLDGYARALVAGRYDTARSAARDFLRELDRLRQRYPGAAWIAPTERYSRRPIG